MLRNHSMIYTAAILLGVLLFSSGLVNIASALGENQPVLNENEPVLIRTAESELSELMGTPKQTKEPLVDDFLEPLAPEKTEESVISPDSISTPEVEEQPLAGKRSMGSLPLKTDSQLIFEKPQVPVRLVISSIDLDARVVPAEWEVVSLWGKELRRWLAPDEGVSGWHTTSAHLGGPGNTVLNGHHNVYGKVFARLAEVVPGDTIKVFSEDKLYQYMVSNVMILSEKYEPLDVRLANAAWIQSSTDERLTLITCWPPETNTHRVIVVAQPVD